MKSKHTLSVQSTYVIVVPNIRVEMKIISLIDRNRGGDTSYFGRRYKGVEES